ncbi:transmembrane protein 140 [Pelodytes ibericus]
MKTAYYSLLIFGLFSAVCTAVFGLDTRFCDCNRLMANVYTLLLHGIVCALLVYALIFKAGDILTSGCKKIGFYNYCFPNRTSSVCYCVTQPKELLGEDVPAPVGLTMALVLTYSSLVLCCMGFLTLLFAQGLNDGSLWVFTMRSNALGLLLLFSGLTIQLVLTWRLLDLSHLGMGFFALLLAIAGLCVLLAMMRHYTNVIGESSNPKGGGEISMDNI